MWECIPDLVLLEVLRHLKASDIQAVAQTCKPWHEVAQNESLWKYIVQTEWKISGGLAPGKLSWRQEYQRLMYETPNYLSETLTDHTDEVLDVSFSHDGNLFCTTSKDATVKVWELGFPTNVKYKANMLILLGWNLTQFSTFNKQDNYLCVCGVQFPTEDVFTASAGRAAVFRMNDFKLMQTMKMDPPQLFADWYDNNTILGGYVGENRGILHIKAFQVIEKDSAVEEPELGHIVYSFQMDNHNINDIMNLLVAEVPCQHRSHDRAIQSVRHNGDIHVNLINGTENKNNSNIAPLDTRMQKHSNDTRITQFTACSCDKNEKLMIFVCGEHSAIALHNVTDLHKKISLKTSKQTTTNKVGTSSLLSTSQSNGTNKSLSGVTRLKQNIKSNGLLPNDSHQQRVSQQHSNPNVTPLFDKPTSKPSFDTYYISGMKLTADNSELYFNYRVCDPDKFDEYGYPVLKSNIVVEKYDLITRKHSSNLYSGHKAFSTYPAWYLCLDISDDYIVSGSEDGCGYLWDRYYRCFLGKLQHGTDDGLVVNGTSFSPTNSQCIVTGADDGIVHVWRSPKLHAQLQKKHGHIPMDI